MSDKFKKIKMPEQDPVIRAKNFNEVTLGLSADDAIKEASRCIQCKKPFCSAGCPVNVAIPEFIQFIKENKFFAAFEKIKEAHAFPSVCGRVCPQETQCEGKCILAKKGDAVAIGNLERFVADWVRENHTLITDEIEIKPINKANTQKIAIVGSGPASLVAASELASAGFNVTIFEALHEVGGVLMYGIPEFRLPKDIVKKEIQSLEKLGIKIIKNFIVGKTATVDDLLEDYQAVFIGTGAGLPVFMNIPGENSLGVYSANEYLTRVNLMKAYLFGARTPITKGKTVVTIGGGNVAMDAARTALRLDADTSIIVYRRTEKEMPARIEEIHHAKAEGVRLELLCSPLAVLSDDDGRVCGLKCIKMTLGEPDASGRQRPTEIAGSEFVIPCQAVIVAIGNKPNPIIQNTTSDIVASTHGTIIANPDDGRTSKKFVYAGGDVVTGAATVIRAMQAGKKAAKSIITDLLS